MTRATLASLAPHLGVALLALTPLALAPLAVAPLGCASAPAPAAAAPTEPAATSATADRSLYERLGGKPAIEAVIDSFLGHVARDPRIAHRFALSDLKDLRAKLVDQVCQATGGPCTYTGKDMKSAHTNQRITDADFNALVEDLVKALDDHKVPDREKGELLSALASMRGDIVGR